METEMTAREAREQREAAEAAELAPVLSWIRAHGSERLRLAALPLPEGEALREEAWRPIYKDEKMAAELPGWEWDKDGSDRPIRRPSLAALKALQETRLAVEAGVMPISDLGLTWIEWEAEVDPTNGDETPARGAAYLMGKFLGRWVRKAVK